MMRRRMMMGQSGGDDDDNPYASEYLTFTAVQRTRFRNSNSNIAIGENSAIEYSLDGGNTWTALATITDYTPYLEIGESICWKIEGGFSPAGTSIQWQADGLYDVSGNIMSLCYGSHFKGKKVISIPSQFAGMWMTMGAMNGKVRDASNLVLPATTLSDGCYTSMFAYHGASLIGAPVLPAATLTEQCYFYMFAYCTSLNHIECYATDISASNCLNGWVTNLPATGTFVKDPTMTSWPTGVNGIPSGWTVTNNE